MFFACVQYFAECGNWGKDANAYRIIKSILFIYLAIFMPCIDIKTS